MFSVSIFQPIHELQSIFKCVIETSDDRCLQMRYTRTLHIQGAAESYVQVGTKRFLMKEIRKEYKIQFFPSKQFQ